MKEIIIQGAREHNLKNITLAIPRGKLTVITGLSGSGKSSLAFDTLYAEGQRRYVESLSAYARQFLELMSKPDVDLIEGLSPAISIEQKTTSRNPRSTVGTITEIYDYLRLLFARIGVPYSPATGLPIVSQTVGEMVDIVSQLPEGEKIYILSPMVRGRKGEYRKEIESLKKQGFTRLKVDGTIYEIDDIPPLNKNVKHSIDVVVDRLKIRAGLEQRLADTIETSLKLSDGLVYVETFDGSKKLTLSEKFACPESGFTLDEIEPRLFSFNNPFGACPACDGLGVKEVFEPDRIIPDPSLSLLKAIDPWTSSSSDYYKELLKAMAGYFNIKLDEPYSALPEEVKQTLLYGSGDTIIPLAFHDGRRYHKIEKPFEGIIPHMERRWKNCEHSWAREEMEKYMGHQPCETCHGYRLKQEALLVKIDQHHVGEVTEKTIGEALVWINNLESKIDQKKRNIAERIIREIRHRLNFLVNVGLDYLTLSRVSGTLSGGESQRIRLASQIGSGLTGVMYVLDEPSIGLHQRDNDRLIATLKHLRDQGNSVIVVEHDEDAIRQADHIIDMGPGAGVHGGEVIAQGTLSDIESSPESLTGKYLTGKKFIPVPTKRRPGSGHSLILSGVTTHNLKDVTATFPLGTFTCVTGVSGGGKSSLVIETLFKVISQKLLRSRQKVGSYQSIDGLEFIDKVIDIDQSPIGRTPRSNPATYTGAFTPIREWFAGLPQAKARGYSSGRFSFNVKGGRCSACQGDGVIKIEMHFLPDVYIECDQCKGKRYNRETLEIKYKGYSIADVLDLTIEEAVEFFEAMPLIHKKLKTLVDVGLGYIRLGQRATTLSGGEAQRVKLAKELARQSTGKTLYILDEPTTGLHFDDIRQLLEVLHSLVEKGNTVIVIEHNLEVIKTADWIIDIGPEGGKGGGKIIAEGAPETILNVKGSYTAQYLKPYLIQNKRQIS